MAKNDVKTTKPTIVRGKPKSGRVWKNEKTRFSSTLKTRGIHRSLQAKQTLKSDLKRIKETSKAIKQAHKDAKEQKKERRRANLKRQEENRKKSEIVQVITNSKKLKTMKKKHLRNVEKRDTTVIEK